MGLIENLDLDGNVVVCLVAGLETFAVFGGGSQAGCSEIVDGFGGGRCTDLEAVDCSLHIGFEIDHSSLVDWGQGGLATDWGRTLGILDPFGMAPWDFDSLERVVVSIPGIVLAQSFGARDGNLLKYMDSIHQSLGDQ